MDKELEFVDQILDFYTAEDRELLLGKNALRIWRFPDALHAGQPGLTSAPGFAYPPANKGICA